MQPEEQPVLKISSLRCLCHSVFGDRKGSLLGCHFCVMDDPTGRSGDAQAALLQASLPQQAAHRP